MSWPETAIQLLAFFAVAAYLLRAVVKLLAKLLLMVTVFLFAAAVLGVASAVHTVLGALAN
ncbi:MULTISPECIES: hypothetical protein [Actinomadura]|uniref:hypothetical protein n=1 Tax=Actinomadura TaxID=1988 RepID=UPI0003AD1900|nr:hypothetical protein [Actinomadura madurae]SPT50203.1 Uncharacterised protein [Actinomadura madurae]